MVDPVTGSYAASCLVLLAGVGIGLRLLWADDADAERGRFAPLLLIPGFAALSYAVMATGMATITVDGVTVYAFRYLDWLVTTPILVGYVGFVAGAPRKWIGGVMGADALMILVGSAAVFLSGPAKWAAFAVSAGCHLCLLYALYGAFPAFAREHPDRRRLFGVLQNHVGLLWIAYPAIWLVSPVGLGIVSTVGTAMVIAYLDAVAKTPYIYFVWRERHSFADGEEAVTTGVDPGTPAAAD